MGFLDHITVSFASKIGHQIKAPNNNTLYFLWYDIYFQLVYIYSWMCFCWRIYNFSNWIFSITFWVFLSFEYALLTCLKCIHIHETFILLYIIKLFLAKKLVLVLKLKNDIFSTERHGQTCKCITVIPCFCGFPDCLHHFKILHNVYSCVSKIQVILIINLFYLR